MTKTSCRLGGAFALHCVLVGCAQFGPVRKEPIPEFSLPKEQSVHTAYILGMKTKLTTKALAEKVSTLFGTQLLIGSGGVQELPLPPRGGPILPKNLSSSISKALAAKGVPACTIAATALAKPEVGKKNLYKGECIGGCEGGEKCSMVPVHDPNSMCFCLPPEAPEQVIRAKGEVYHDQCHAEIPQENMQPPGVGDPTKEIVCHGSCSTGECKPASVTVDLGDGSSAIYFICSCGG